MVLNVYDQLLLMKHHKNEVNEVFQYYFYMNHKEMVELNDEYMNDQKYQLHLN
jgi:CRISPR/Cas system-associated exonuclease Cas4 (RecB family)